MNTPFAKEKRKEVEKGDCTFSTFATFATFATFTWKQKSLKLKTIRRALYEINNDFHTELCHLIPFFTAFYVSTFLRELSRSFSFLRFIRAKLITTYLIEHNLSEEEKKEKSIKTI